MIRSGKHRSYVKCLAALLLWFSTTVLILSINIWRKNPTGVEVSDVERARCEDKHQFTAVLLHWKRSLKTQQVVHHYLRSELFEEIIVWNNNPQIHLSVDQLLNGSRMSTPIRLINSRENLKDEAKYLACTEARTSACFYADDDWDTSGYIRTLLASFLSDPTVLHSATNAPTYYNNLLWSFMDQQIDLHSSFSWIGSGSVFLREHARRHLDWLRAHLQADQRSMTLADSFVSESLLLLDLFAFGDLFFSVWLNDVPTQLIVDLRSLPTHGKTNETAFSSTSGFYSLQHQSSVLAIRVLEQALRGNQTKAAAAFPRQQQRRFPYLVKSPSLNDTFLFFTNVLPLEIEGVPFNISVDADRGTYRNVPHGPNFEHFTSHNTMAAVDRDMKTCWNPNRSIRTAHFFGLDLLSHRRKIAFRLTIGHSHVLQTSLDLRVSSDRLLWNTPVVRAVRSNASEYLFELSSPSSPFRYLLFNATKSSEEVFQVCDVRVIEH